MKDTTQIVSKITYTKVERSIENFKQKTNQIEYTLRLTDNTVQSDSHTFQLNHIFDMSYKPFTNGNGLLYLHTNEGVFPYVISTNPEPFIRSFKQLTSDNQ